MIYFSGYGKGEKSMSDERTIKPNKPANFTPQLGDYKTLQPFRYWCQKVLPLVYDDSLSYYELLCKVVDYLKMLKLYMVMLLICIQLMLSCRDM